MPLRWGKKPGIWPGPHFLFCLMKMTAPPLRLTCLTWGPSVVDKEGTQTVGRPHVGQGEHLVSYTWRLASLGRKPERWHRVAEVALQGTFALPGCLSAGGQRTSLGSGAPGQRVAA